MSSPLSAFENGTATIDSTDSNAAAMTSAPEESFTPKAEEEPIFEIIDFRIVGNSIFPTVRLQNLLEELTGPGRNAADVEKARDLLEKYHHENGYPTVLVNIPEQSIESGVIKLQVIESRIGSTTVKGSRYYSSGRILERLPSLAPGTILHVPDVQEEINRLNRTADLKVIPAMNPGKSLGVVDVELKAEEKFPLHGSIELSNRAGNNTSALRLNGAIHYDNLWDLDHSLSLQYQTAPLKTSEVEVFSGSYMMPAPWKVENTLVLYGVVSNSDTAFGEGFKTVGKGKIAGTRYIAPLTAYRDYNHNLVSGLDYKKFDETVGTAKSSGSEISTPVEYLPFTLGYNGSHPDSSGLTLWNAGLNVSFRELVVHQKNMTDKRASAKGNYFTAILGAERQQKLPGETGLTVKLDGQISDQPLISNEQYSAGGMESVRGYKESELSGDSAFHGVTELTAPDLATVFKLGSGFQLKPYLFYDFAMLWTKDALPSQPHFQNLQGTGLGLRGALFRNLEYQADWAFALKETSRAASGSNRVHFRVKYQF